MANQDSIKQQKLKLKRKIDEVEDLLNELKGYMDRVKNSKTFQPPSKKVKFNDKGVKNPPQQKITTFLPVKVNKNQIVHQIFEEILTQAWLQLKQGEIIPKENQSLPLLEHAAECLKSASMMLPAAEPHGSGKKVKVRYSHPLRKSVEEKLESHSLHAVFLLFNRKIPRNTLWEWKQKLHTRNVKKTVQGRKTKLRALEEELYTWFLILRARKLVVSDSLLRKKALKIKDEIADDDNISESAKINYKDFKASNGWIEKFKQRYQLSKRCITTKCLKTIEEMRESLKSYFADLTETLNKMKPKYIYNMDEVGIFFEAETNYTLEVKGKKIIGKITSGKSKERLTLVVTVCSNGTLLPPFIIFKVAKPRGKTFSDIPNKEIHVFDQETEQIIRKTGIVLCQNYTAWMNKRIMMKYYLPYYEDYTAKHTSLLILDNCGPHTADEVAQDFNDRNLFICI